MVKSNTMLPRNMTILVTLFLLVSIFTTVAASMISHTITPRGRALLQLENGTQSMFKDDRTVRVDPLDHLNKYRGGYDITNKHYWSSLIFTGIYGYAIGVAWLLCGLLYGVLLLAAWLISRKTNDSKVKRRTSLPCTGQCSFRLLLLAATFLTVLALIASGVVLGGNSKFHSVAKKVVNIIIETADDASTTIYNTTGAIKGLNSSLAISSLDNGTSNGEASTFLTSTSQRLDNEAATIRTQARRNRRIIDKGLTIVYAVATAIVSVNLIALLSLLVCGVFRFRRGSNMLIIFTWVLTALCWSLFGAIYFLDKFSGDTCAAISSFQQNPRNNSLSSILPCDELLSAKPLLSDVNSGIYDLVTEVNANISTLKATALPSLAFVCNPFSGPPDFRYRPENCSTDTIKIGDIPQILRAFTCGNTTCKDGEFIPFSDYRRIEAYTTSIQDIMNAIPGMQDLIECNSVSNAFAEILTHHCTPLKRNARMAWIAILLLSIFMVPLILLWTMKARQETKFHPLGSSSVRPNHVI